MPMEQICQVYKNDLSTWIPPRGAAIKPFSPVMERLLALEVLERPALVSDAGREHSAPARGVHLHLRMYQLWSSCYIKDQV